FIRKHWIGYSAACFASFRTDTRPAVRLTIKLRYRLPHSSGALLPGRLTSARGQRGDGPRPSLRAMFVLLANSRTVAWGVALLDSAPKEEPLPARRGLGLSGHER